MKAITTRRRGSNAENETSNSTTCAPPRQTVRFENVNGSARTVRLAGDFNDWHPESMEMIPLSGGKWAKDLSLIPGSYEYRLVVDDQWQPDPGNWRCVPNTFGGQNSIKVVPPQASLRHVGPSALRTSALARQ